MGKQEAVQQLWDLQFRNSGAFHEQLYCLMVRAGAQDFDRLCSAFPVHGEVFKEWCKCETQAGFFEKYGLNLPGYY